MGSEGVTVEGVEEVAPKLKPVVAGCEETVSFGVSNFGCEVGSVLVSVEVPKVKLEAGAGVVSVFFSVSVFGG